MVDKDCHLYELKEYEEVTTGWVHTGCRENSLVLMSMDSRELYTSQSRKVTHLKEL